MKKDINWYLQHKCGMWAITREGLSFDDIKKPIVRKIHGKNRIIEPDNPMYNACEYYGEEP